MKKIFPYILIVLSFIVFIIFRSPETATYKFNNTLAKDYLRSQDIEDPEGFIKDRVILNDSDIYQSAGYLYAKGNSPTAYDFQHPALVKYLYGFSIILSGNPYWVQIIFGAIFLLLTYFLSTKIIKNKWLAMIPPILILIDPLFKNVLNGAYLDMGQSVFALLFVILTVFYPGKFVLQGITLGLFSASKFWSTAGIFFVIIYAYKFITKQKINYKKVIVSLFIAFITFSLVYVKAFIDAGGAFNIFAFLGKEVKFMLTHNSASGVGGSILLFVSGYFAPWWKDGIDRAGDWNLLWPIGLMASIFLAIKTKFKIKEGLIYVFSLVYLLLTSTGVPFTRYFLIILPFVYISLVKIVADTKFKWNN